MKKWFDAEREATEDIKEALVRILKNLSVNLYLVKKVNKEKTKGRRK